ncbi:hypothetical protein PG5_20650 [Pseudomonas sp. G5(2012)]|nr:hypothetical protein PG5_20650 [Pseudomonas sp. G5(2012)]
MVGRHGKGRFSTDRSHALRGNASMDALRLLLGRGASRAAFPRRAWERSCRG